MGDIGDPFLPHPVRFSLQAVALPDFLVHPVQTVINLEKSSLSLNGKIAARSDLPDGVSELLHGLSGPKAVEHAGYREDEKEYGCHRQDHSLTGSKMLSVQIHGDFGNFHRKEKDVTVFSVLK